MKMSELKRNPKKVHAALIERGGAYYAGTDMRIVVPARYRARRLLTMGAKTKLLGICMYVLDDNSYGISTAPAILSLSPDDSRESYLDGAPTIELFFNKGSKVFTTTDVVMEEKLLYFVYKEIVSMGNVPSFFNYNDLGRLFDFAKYFAGSNPAGSISILHLLLSYIARDPQDLTAYFRQTTDGDNLDNAVFVPLRSTTHGASNAIAKIMGGHFSDKITSALVNPTVEEEPIEHLLRM